MATTELAADPRVRRGLGAQLAERRRCLERGERALGWKLGFGSSAAMDGLAIAAPLVGFLLRGALLERGARISLRDWARPMLEPEVALRLGEDLPAGDDAASARCAIAELAPAIELAHVHPPPADVERILAGNVFQRRLVLGEWSPAADLDGLGARVRRGGEPARPIEDPWALTGEPIELVRHVADLLGEFGHLLRAGEVVICGSVVPAIAAEGEGEVGFELAGRGAVTIRFDA